MFSFLKFVLYFSISFVILSIPIKRKVLFNYMHSVFAPYTTAILKSVKDEATRGYRAGSRLTKQLFDNSPPEVVDSVRSRISSGMVKHNQQDAYTQEEQELLNKVLEDNSKN